MAQYDTMISLNPENPAVRNNYSVALYVAGRLPEAWAQFETARKLGGAPNRQYEAALRAAMNKP